MRYEKCFFYFKVNKILFFVCLMFKILKKNYFYLYVKCIMGLMFDNYFIDDNN